TLDWTRAVSSGSGLSSSLPPAVAPGRAAQRLPRSLKCGDSICASSPDYLQPSFEDLPLLAVDQLNLTCSSVSAEIFIDGKGTESVVVRVYPQPPQSSSLNSLVQATDQTQPLEDSQGHPIPISDTLHL
ncbi:hypothetical protein U0070_022067, partial [Myodes glareolus]